MKHLRIVGTVALLIFFASALCGQKNDYVWIFGYGSNPTDSTFGGSVIDFNASPPNIYYKYIPMNMDATNASICDDDGNLQFYTNGIYAENYLQAKVEGSDTLNPGIVSDNHYYFGYPLLQGALILPPQSNDSIYSILHMNEVPSSQGLSYRATGLFHTLVDMRLNNYDGKVFVKSVPLVFDTLILSNLTATRNSDGINWWVIIKEYNSHRFNKILYGPSGVELIEKQTIGSNPWGLDCLASFSPDGTKYAEFCGGTLQSGKNLEIYDFNRCTGELSNPLWSHFFDGTYLAGLAFSPNSRFLYLSSGLYIYQFDLQADDVLASKDTVAVYDGSASPFSTTFLTAQLAPDGRIYINSPNSSNTLHVIHHPDLKGDSCMVEQNGIQLPTYNAISMPNFPNYRLGAIPPITPSFSHSTAGDTAFFQNTSVNGAHFDWDFGDGSKGSGNEVSHVYEQPGSYTVTLTASDGCLSEVAVDTVTVVFTGAGERMEWDTGFVAYPNPAKNEITLSFEARKGEGRLTVLDVFGRQIESRQILGNMVGLTLQTESWQNGIYFFRLIFDDESPSTRSIIISH